MFFCFSNAGYTRGIIKHVILSTVYPVLLALPIRVLIFSNTICNAVASYHTLLQHFHALVCYCSLGSDPFCQILFCKIGWAALYLSFPCCKPWADSTVCMHTFLHLHLDVNNNLTMFTVSIVISCPPLSVQSESPGSRRTRRIPDELLDLMWLCAASQNTPRQ